MGEAKRKKARLGEWYGKPVVPGHPDYAPPPPKPNDETRRVVLAGNRGQTFRLFALAAALTASVPGIDISPPPSMRKR